MKKLLLLSAVLFLPFFASAATLNNNFTVANLYPAAGSTTNVSSSCGLAGANGSVSFVLSQNGINTVLSNNLSTDPNGNFSGNVTFPAIYPAGSTTIIATCSRTGDTINSPTLTFASPASSSFGFSNINPTVGGVINLAGSCGASNGSGSVQLNLNYNGSTYQLSNVSLTPTGTFSSNVVIPSTVNTGSGSLSATCSNGASFSSNVVIGPAAVDFFAFGSNPFPGSNTTISGNCNNVTGNQNSTVSFSVMRYGAATTLSATNNTTTGNGYFNSTVNFPSNIGSDPATLVVTCPNGSTFSNVIMLSATSNAVDPVTTTPVGGVAAGSPPEAKNNYPLYGSALVLSGLIGLFAIKGKRAYVQK